MDQPLAWHVFQPTAGHQPHADSSSDGRPAESPAGHQSPLAGRSPGYSFDQVAACPVGQPFGHGFPVDERPGSQHGQLMPHYDVSSPLEQASAGGGNFSSLHRLPLL